MNIYVYCVINLDQYLHTLHSLEYLIKYFGIFCLLLKLNYFLSNEQIVFTLFKFHSHALYLYPEHLRKAGQENGAISLFWTCAKGAFNVFCVRVAAWKAFVSARQRHALKLRLTGRWRADEVEGHGTGQARPVLSCCCLSFNPFVKCSVNGLFRATFS